MDMQTPKANSLFLGKNGQIILEAESATPTGDWKQVTVQGETSLLWDASQSSYGKVPTGQTLSYQFETDKTGTYSIAMHSGRVKSAMNASDRFENGKERTDTGNDAYVSIVNAETGKVVQKPTKLFTGLGSSDKTLKWGTTFDASHKKSPAQVSLEANTQYRLEIAGRSDGYALDRITLSNSGFLKNADLPQSPTQGNAPNPAPTPTPAPNAFIGQFDHIVSHFDGNNNDDDDIAALPVAAMLTNAAGLQKKSTFFYSNNVGEPNDNYQVGAMRESAAFAEKLGIKTYDYQANADAATTALVKLFNSGKKVLSIEGGPMEAVYRALEKTAPKNLKNIQLLSHSSWNENRDIASRPGVKDVRTWSDIRKDFPDVKLIEIVDQNGPDGGGPLGFNSDQWKWLDGSKNQVLQEARDLMVNARAKVNDPSDAGMHFYAITGQEKANPNDARTFFDANPPKFGAGPTPPVDPPTPNPTDAIRINAGGAAFTDSSSKVWGKDTYFKGGNTYTTGAGIGKTADDTLFQSERYQKNLAYAIPVENGSYQVNLDFAEIYFGAAGKRVFDVKAEGALKLDDFDIFAAAGGKNKKVQKSFQVKVTDGTLNLDLGASVNNAKLSAIEVLKASGSAPQPPAPKTLRFEAEEMQLTGYRPESGAFASGGKFIGLVGGADNETGKATLKFSGPTGKYDVRVGYFDENDGIAKLSVAQGQNVLEDWALNQQLGSNLAAAKTKTSRQVASGLQVEAGDVFTLKGVEQGMAPQAEHARIDYIEFVPSGANGLGASSAIAQTPLAA
ncbi:MAG: malectin domain-containing carbohydrate-binding protein [Cyanobacteria bacterium P01_A01_bin.114]